MTEQQPSCERPTCPLTPYRSKNGRGLCVKHALAAGYIHHDEDSTFYHQGISEAVQDGWTNAAIAEVTGLNVTTVSDIRLAHFPRVDHNTADRLREFFATRSTIPTVGYVPAWHAARRLRALRAAGKSLDELSAGIGSKPQWLSTLCNHDEGRSISQDAHRRILAYYEAHEMDPVTTPSPRVGRRRWPVPMEWHNIDDPDEAPERPKRPVNWHRTHLNEGDRHKVARLIAHYGSRGAVNEATGIHIGILDAVLNATGGRTVTCDALERITAADAAIGEPPLWRDYLPPRGGSAFREITDADRAAALTSRRIAGSFRAVEDACQLPEQLTSRMVSGKQRRARRAWLDRIHDYVNAHTEESTHAA